MAKVMVSNVCRLGKDEAEFVASTVTSAGISRVPELPHRQIHLVPTLTLIAKLKWHRDAYVACVTRAQADLLVEDGKASKMYQNKLVYTIERYLNDKDVRKDADEYKRAIQAKADGVEFVLVGIIAPHRSALAVCRNILSGCQDIKELGNDCEGAVIDANCVLIED